MTEDIKPCACCQKYAERPCECACHGEPRFGCGSCGSTGYHALLSLPPRYELCPACRTNRP